MAITSQSPQLGRVARVRLALHGPGDTRIDTAVLAEEPAVLATAFAAVLPEVMPDRSTFRETIEEHADEEEEEARVFVGHDPALGIDAWAHIGRAVEPTQYLREVVEAIPHGRPAATRIGLEIRVVAHAETCERDRTSPVLERCCEGEGFVVRTRRLAKPKVLAHVFATLGVKFHDLRRQREAGEAVVFEGLWLDDGRQSFTVLTGIDDAPGPIEPTGWREPESKNSSK